MDRRWRPRWWPQYRFLVLVGVVAMALGALGAFTVRATQHSGRPNFAAIMSVAPDAYTGVCAVTERDGQWYEGGLNITNRPVPIPCSNLSGYVLTDPQSGSMEIATETTTSNGRNGFTVATSNELWITVSPRRSDGSYLIRWGAAPGVRVEWLFAFVNQPGPGLTHGDPSHYPNGLVWRPFKGVTQPIFRVYANVVGAPAGIPVAISGTNLAPMPLQPSVAINVALKHWQPELLFEGPDCSRRGYSQLKTRTAMKPTTIPHTMRPSRSARTSMSVAPLLATWRNASVRKVSGR